MVRALILEAAKGKRILCTREVQKSLRDSVKQLIDDQIKAMGFESVFDSVETEIRAPNGGSFIFTGLSGQTSDSLKSYEGIDICFCEEAHSISKKSWETLIPTIRKPGSEIWIAFNPALETDETWQRFIVNTPPGSFVREVNYNDNPWFPDVLEQERLHCLATDPVGYKNIWEGKPRSAVEGAIYASEITEAQQKGRICALPYDPKLLVHTVWDLGWNDSTSIALVQRGQFELRIVKYIQADHKPIDWYVATLKEMKWNWGNDWLPHDSKQGSLQTGKNVFDMVKELGRKPKLIPNAGVENGIKLARAMFPKVYFDKAETVPLVESLRRYRRNINVKHGEPGTPVHDEFSHGADAFRYLAVVADQLRNEEYGYGHLPLVLTEMLDSEIGY